LDRAHLLWALRALGLVTMGGHISIAGPTKLPVAGSSRWNTLAPHTTCATSPVAHIWP